VGAKKLFETLPVGGGWKTNVRQYSPALHQMMVRHLYIFHLYQGRMTHIHTVLVKF
jgi:hypothetical protein